MGKYEPLGVFLSEQTRNQIPMTFEDIEKIVGTNLPASKQYPAWWSNNPWNNVMTQVWLDAGYQTESVNTSSGKLVFRRVSRSDQNAKPTETGGSDQNKVATKSLHHPMFGCMKGLITIPDDLDLTEPADPNWGSNTYGSEK